MVIQWSNGCRCQIKSYEEIQNERNQVLMNPDWKEPNEDENDIDK